jgi:hypothetical protein
VLRWDFSWKKYSTSLDSLEYHNLFYGNYDLNKATRLYAMDVWYQERDIVKVVRLLNSVASKSKAGAKRT